MFTAFTLMTIQALLGGIDDFLASRDHRETACQAICGGRTLATFSP